MDESDEFEIIKMEIRGLLISNKEGCCLSEFKKQYRSMLGRTLPFVQFGYKNEIEFLSAMPDAVQISSTGRDYYLFGIADEKSKHIQKMVSKQKSTKKKPSGRLNPMLRYVPPPKRYELVLSTSRRSKELLPSSASKRSNELKPSSAPKWSNELQPSSSSRRSYELPPRFQTKMKKQLPQLVMNEIVDLVCKYPTGLSLRDVLIKYRQIYNKELSFRDYGFFTLQDCLEEIPSLFLKPKNNDTLVLCIPEIERPFSESSKMNNYRDNVSATYEVPKISEAVSPAVQSFEDSSNHLHPENLSGIPSPHENISNFNEYENHSSDFKMKVSSLDDFNFNMRKSPEVSIISENIRSNLIRVVENCPHGIWAREFPALYKEITKTEFDLHVLGFYDLATFIDSVPDILTRRSLPSSKKDYLIYPAWTINEMDREDPKSAAFAIEIIIGNTRKILQANQEGITLKDFLYIYSLNCSEPLYFVNLGFDSLENLLVAIADRVPLKFEVKGGVKSVHLVSSEEKSTLQLPGKLETLPINAVSPFKQFTQQTLPAEMDLNQFFPVFVSSVNNVDHIYIQLLGEDTSDVLIKKYEDLERFYSSSQSKDYLMKDFHIAAGSIGVALWPVDMHWYRIRIMSVVSSETVQVFYVDYGTIEIISKNLLRYIREEFFDFPTQAIKASLAYVKPSLTDSKRNSVAKARILELCTDITVMAKIHHIKDGLLSLVLCDTNGKEDVYINDVLLMENLACSSSDNDNNSQLRGPQESAQCLPEIPPPTLPAIQATDPTQVIGMLLQAYSSLAASKTSPVAPSNFPMDSTAITAAIAQAAQNLSQNSSASGVDFSKLFQAPSTHIVPPIPCPKPSVTDSWQHPSTVLSHPSSEETASCSLPSEENEVFDDVDDAFFDEFYQKVSIVTKRYVKRIRTDDGYMFHILIYESKPFVSCGDICSLIWYNKNSDYLLQRLQNGESVLSNTVIWENQNEDMFDQLKRFHVKGFKERNEQFYILVYPLNTLVQILNVFGHPSSELRSRILNEFSSFNPEHPMWLELSEVEIPDGEEEFAGKTDDDKLNRLCLYDLQTMKQGIRIRRQNLESQRSKNPEDVSDEKEKLKLLYNKVIRRIKEIEQICSNFA
ncbi:tudor domain-containing protein 5-like isoform X2 [Argiope bruennichi]|uniref:tudor domain-containing protein 5-like isoform X2 n=1 Tax=Argiope bruennichi TaxID=94029 RepID=UPI0024944F92|nr:tudor domain-containing protein 5-like isoform X2 [Argiope bruennichi]